MPTPAFPTALDSFQRKANAPGTIVVADNTKYYATGSVSIGDYNDWQIAIEAIEAKLGINSSAVSTSIDYLLKNSASMNPGHRHNSILDSGNTVNVLVGDANANAIMQNRRFQLSEGAQIASASHLTLGGDGNMFTLSGTTTVDLIDITNWQGGSVVVLIPRSGSITFNNATAASGSFQSLHLRTGANTTVVVNTPIGFVWENINASSWFQLF